MTIRRWTNDVDPRTIPEAVLKREWARRNSLRRKRFGAGPGRPKSIRSCSGCGARLGARELRLHRCNARWKTRLVTGKFPDRRFDVEFWRSQGDEAIFSAAWEMIELAEATKYGRKPRLQRAVTRLQ